MPTFALPLATSTTTVHAQSHTSRVRFSNLPTRKRKRSSKSSPELSSPDVSGDENDGGLVPASTNPLSLTPAEIAQYKVAGLRLDEEVPSVKGWPHRGLPTIYNLSPETSGRLERKDVKGKGKAIEEVVAGEEEAKKGTERGPQLRVQHFSVLTTILHRCLLEGDIERAKRAWGMVIRGQFGGKGIDVRSNGYWGIGAELLMRSLDQPDKNKPSYEYDSDSDGEDGERGEDEREEEGRWKWGSKEGLEKMKDYYERLILQHPYKRHFHTSVNALDFWPAMVGCEVYGVQEEQKQSLRRLEKEENEDDGEERGGSESEIDSEEEEEDDGFLVDQRRKDRRRKRRADRRWVERDEIRQAALAASEKIAARLDELMGTPPFSDSHNLLRLRGMLALYIGDLSVLAKPVEDDDDSEDEKPSRSQRSSQREKDRRFFFRQRMNDHERGKKKQVEEQERARGLFLRIQKSGGSVEDIKFMDMVEDQEEDLEAED